MRVERTLDVNSYQLTGYGDYTTDRFYVEGAVSAAWNKNDPSRTVLGRTATSTYNGQQYSAQLGAGMPLSFGQHYVTPTVGMSWSLATADDYTETGAGALGLKISTDDVQTLTTSAGARWHRAFALGKGSLTPVVRAGVSYDILGQESVATGTYTGGGASFKTTGAEVQQLAANVGGGVTYQSNNWTLGTNVDAQIKSQYFGLSATVQAKLAF